MARNVTRREFLQTGCGAALTALGGAPAADAFTGFRPAGRPAQAKQSVMFNYTTWELYPNQTATGRKLLVEPYEAAHPGVKINNTTIPGFATYTTHLDALFAAGTLAGCLRMQRGVHVEFRAPRSASQPRDEHQDGHQSGRLLYVPCGSRPLV